TSYSGFSSTNAGIRESSQSVWMLVSVLRKTVSDVTDPSPESSLPPAAEPGDCCTHPVSARAAANGTAPAATKRRVLTAYLLVRRVPPGSEVAVAGPEKFRLTVDGRPSCTSTIQTSLSMSGRTDICTRWTASCCGACRYRGEQEVVGLSRSKYAVIASAVLLVSAVVSAVALVTRDPHELVSMRLDVLNRAGQRTPLVEASVSPSEAPLAFRALRDAVPSIIIGVAGLVLVGIAPSWFLVLAMLVTAIVLEASTRRRAREA